MKKPALTPFPVPNEVDVAAILKAVKAELTASCLQHPNWPTDLLIGDQIINEEKGEATRATLNYVFEKGSLVEVEDELVQTAAMVIKQLLYIRANKWYYV